MPKIPAKIGDLTPPRSAPQPQQPESGEADLYFLKYEKTLLDRGMPAAEAATKAKWWAELKRGNPYGVVGPGDDAQALWRAEKGQAGAIDTVLDSITASAPVDRVSATMGLPVVKDRNNGRWLGSRAEVNRYSANPAYEYFSQLVPSFAGPPTTMFASGDWPRFTASGLDVSVLKFVPWRVRHACAFHPDRSFVLQAVELADSLTGSALDGSRLEDEFQTVTGQEHLARYFEAALTWANTPVNEDGELTEEDIRRAYPSGLDV
jgi:hypothetical protein